MMLPGALLFSRYAFMPNHLGYCGGRESLTLLEYGTSGRVDQGLIDLERQFEAAYPYLQLIAQANQVADPLDTRVVEAYWVGNALLEGVDMASLYASLQQRFQPRTTPGAWSWLASKVPAGARPHHSFHVLEVYSRAGTMRAGVVERLVETMQQCLIRWGRVRVVSGAQLVVEAPSLQLQEGKLHLSEPRLETITRWHDGRGFVDEVREGNWVGIHWGWACDILTPPRKTRLEHYTRFHLALCNQTL